MIDRGGKSSMLYNKLKEFDREKEVIMRVIEKVDLKELYEIDEYLWIQETVKLLKEKQLDKIDLENLIDELINQSQKPGVAIGIRASRITIT